MSRVANGMARCYIRVETCEFVATLLEQTFGSKAPEVQEVVAALRSGAQSRRAVSSNRSVFTPLLQRSPQTYPVANQAEADAVRASAHSWAHYHGHKVCVRTVPAAGQVAVYLVQQAPA